jgi:5'(3')-deoxyribonucleotidase
MLDLKNIIPRLYGKKSNYGIYRISLEQSLLEIDIDSFVSREHIQNYFSQNSIDKFDVLTIVSQSGASHFPVNSIKSIKIGSNELWVNDCRFSKDYVCVDIDGVITNFNGNMQNYLKRTKNLDFDPEKCINYNYKYDLGFDRHIIYDAIKSPEFYETLGYFDESIKALAKLQKFVQTKAYTGAVNNDEIVHRRKQLLHELHLFGNPITSGSKPTDLGAVALFDDCLGVHKQWITDNSKALLFLIDAPYNREANVNDGSLDWSRIIRCKNFAEAVDKFLSMKVEGNNGIEV